MYFLIIIKLITNNKIYQQPMEDEETNFSLPSLIDSESLLQEVIFLFKFFRLLISLYLLLSHLHPAARQFCRSTYTITDITIK
jgi:hypothetical protein